MFDLDGKAAYAGKSSKLRSRLRQHFVRQDSSVVSYGRLDIWDISYVDWWETSETDRAEQKLLSTHQPYLNFDDEITSPSGSVDLNLEHPDGTVELVSEEEREFRSEPYNRSKQKLEHLLRMVDTIKLAGHSEATKKTLYAHQRIFHENVSEFLGVEPEEASADLSDWTE
ncbi:GIY-YIG nuclease family protein [Natrinema salinisoli]|uniref:GIY-YIG nuclease family protein n=1 Tax=Natrinema salinisoli TaxID=2878535 RepID=UPI002023090F|nr:GIY-YIG nuclease family protein [Natrinema salinisoli]